MEAEEVVEFVDMVSTKKERRSPVVFRVFFGSDALLPCKVMGHNNDPLGAFIYHYIEVGFRRVLLQYGKDFLTWLRVHGKPTIYL